MTVFDLFKYYKPKYKGKDNLSFYYRRSIYFQNPIKFNDPWDCKVPHMTIPGKRSLKTIWFNMEGQNDPVFAKTEWQKIGKLPSTKIKQLFENLYKKAFEKQRSKIGVFSLSFIPDCELMWSHYASSHSGYMLHFQIDLNQYYTDSSLMSVGIPFPVIYSDKREVWNLADYSTNKEKHSYDLVRIKSKAWEYECELRLINVDKCGFIKAPSNWLKSIVIGIDTDSELQDKLKNIGNSLNVPVLSCKMNKKEYKIDIPGLGINGNDGRTCYQDAIKSNEFEPRPS